MTRTIMPLLAAGMMVAAMSVGGAVAQQPPAAPSAPEPKMPPMPSMEGQQGEVSKPVTQIPSRKKEAVVEKKKNTSPKKSARPSRRKH